MVSGVMFVVVGIVVALLSVMGVAYSLSQVTDPSLKALLAGFGGRPAWFNNGAMDVDGRPVRVVYTPRGKNTPSRLTVALKGDFFAHAIFRSEIQADRFSKEIGLNREIQLYDPAFDSAVYVECEDEPFVRKLLGARDARERVGRILRTFTTLEIDGRECRLIKSPCDDGQGLTQDEMMEAVRAMAALSADIPLPLPGQATATPVTDECRRTEGFFVGFSGALMMSGVFLMVWGLVAFPPVLPGRSFVASSYASVAVGGAFLAYIFSQLKGLSNAARYFIIISLLGTAGIVLACWGGLMVLNGSQDVSPLAVHHVGVTGKNITHSKNSTTYHVTVLSWEPGFATYSFSVPQAMYARIEPGDTCAVGTRRGLFGFEWVVSKECHPSS